MSTFRIYKRISPDAVVPNSSRMEQEFGCDGVLHAVTSDKVYFDGDGEVEYAEWLDTTKQGVCDGTCGTESIGVFTHSGLK